MNWLKESAQSMAGRGDNVCQVPHTHHKVKTVDIDLSTHSIPDIPKSVGTAKYMVYDWELYDGTGCYCPGNDEVSLSIDTQGIWEGYEIGLALDIVRKEPGIVLDFGANTGWYSILLALEGCDILAIEADEENVRILQNNALLNRVYGSITVSRGWICSDTPLLASGPRIRLLKSDVEGMENEVVRVCKNLFEDKLIDYALLEVSPIFADHYPDTLGFIVGCGYEAYLVPDKGYDTMKFASDPLGSVLNSQLDLKIIPTLSQRSVLLARK